MKSAIFLTLNNENNNKKKKWFAMICLKKNKLQQNKLSMSNPFSFVISKENK